MKPFVFAAAIDSKKYTPATVLVDEPTTFTLITGRDLDAAELRERPRRSGDAPDRAGAVHQRHRRQAASTRSGPRRQSTTPSGWASPRSRETGRLNDVTLSFALGGLTRGVTPLEMAAAYAVFANGGIRRHPSRSCGWRGPTGPSSTSSAPAAPGVEPGDRVHHDRHDAGRHRAGDRVGRQHRPSRRGQDGNHLFLYGRVVVGYTPSLVTAVWIGNDDNEPMVYPGGRSAAPPPPGRGSGT